ncbi:MAG: ATP-binding protein [Actinomycetota bacterium]
MNIESPPLKVLLVEDNPGDARLLEFALKESDGEGFQVDRAERLSDAQAALGAKGYDIVLLDLSLPDSFGLDTVRGTRASAPNVPIVVLSGHQDEAIAVEAVKEGAQDYLTKGRVDGPLLVRSMRYAIERQSLAVQMEEVRRQQLELKDQFLSHVSHELRTPLSVIYQFVTILLDGFGGDLTSEQRGYLETTLKNTNQLKRMIDDLLSDARDEGGRLSIHPTDLDIADLITETITSLSLQASSSSVDLECAIPNALPPARADEVRIREVLINLIDNALKFTPSGGMVTVEASVLPEKMIRIDVRDSGCGIPEEGLELVFDRFHQESAGAASSRGLGLGLYICKQIINGHGGRIWVESELDRGSVFSFTLPESEESA